MKKLTMLVFGLMLIATLVNAAEFAAIGGTGDVVTSDLNTRAAVSITQNVDPNVMVDATSVSCGVAGSHTAENFYLRRFFLADYSIASHIDVESIDLGIEQADGAPTIDISLHSIATGDAFTFANLTLIATVDVLVDVIDAGTFINVPIAGRVEIGNDLVVIVHSADGEPLLQNFRPGVNDSGVTYDSYIAAETCGITAPTAMSDIGFPESQMVMTVNGNADETTAAEASNFSVVKSLY
ncbi:MAG: hypothetical protein GY835_10685 [bacterium]|nr:hypothetical protein [bacterium]